MTATPPTNQQGEIMKVTDLKPSDAGKKIAVTDQLDREARGTLETVTFTWEAAGDGWAHPKQQVRTAILGISGWTIEVLGHAEVELADGTAVGLPEVYAEYNGFRHDDATEHRGTSG